VRTTKCVSKTYIIFGKHNSFHKAQALLTMNSSLVSPKDSLHFTVLTRASYWYLHSAI